MIGGITSTFTVLSWAPHEDVLASTVLPWCFESAFMGAYLVRAVMGIP